MRKIDTIYKRDPAKPKRVLPERYNPGDECLSQVWAVAATASAKWDGSACLVHEGKFYRRHKAALETACPSNWIHWTMDSGMTHGNGWLLVTTAPQDRYHAEALEGDKRWLRDGTYELVGPKVNGNPHQVSRHTLVRHGDLTIAAPVAFDELAEFLATWPFEGLVWWAKIDGRNQPVGKIKARDFGIDWTKNVRSNRGEF